MRTIFKTLVAASLATVLVGISLGSMANAQCGGSVWIKSRAVQLQSWEAEPQFGTASLLLVANNAPAGADIVGFWKVKFLSEGNAGIPDGTVLDNGFSQWHSDGTEIMNSSKPPVTGDFCLGVWQKNGPSSYQLNHFALGFDSASNFIGPVQIQESVSVDKKADQYSGTFTINQYDPMGNPMGGVAGNVAATRITVDTPIGDVL